MKILALDIATKSGVAVGSAEGKPEFATEDFSDCGSQYAKFSMARIWARNLIRQHEPDLLALEAPIVGGGGMQNRALILIGMRACISAAAYDAGVKVEEYAVSTIRKHFLGSGRVKSKEAKAETIRMCEARGWKVQNDNEADAGAVWDLACARHGFEVNAGGLFLGN